MGIKEQLLSIISSLSQIFLPKIFGNSIISNILGPAIKAAIEGSFKEKPSSSNDDALLGFLLAEMADLAKKIREDYLDVGIELTDAVILNLRQKFSLHMAIKLRDFREVK